MLFHVCAKGLRMKLATPMNHQSYHLPIASNLHTAFEIVSVYSLETMIAHNLLKLWSSFSSLYAIWAWEVKLLQHL